MSTNPPQQPEPEPEPEEEEEVIAVPEPFRDYESTDLESAAKLAAERYD